MSSKQAIMMHTFKLRIHFEIIWLRYPSRIATVLTPMNEKACNCHYIWKANICRLSHDSFVAPGGLTGVFLYSINASTLLYKIALDQISCINLFIFVFGRGPARRDTFKSATLVCFCFCVLVAFNVRFLYCTSELPLLCVDLQ